MLPIALGKATRLLQYLPGDKAYNATIRFGVQTTTDDLQGEVIASCACPELKLEDIKDLLSKFLGKINQIPPSYSAIQVDGKRLYDLARQGIAVEAPVRTVEIFSIEVLDWRPGEEAELDVAIACGAGTYIRSIARDLGAALDVGGTLAALQRTVSSGFNLANSISIEALEAQLQTFQPMSPDAPLQYLPSISLLEEDAKKWRQGQRIAQQINESSQYLRVYTDGLFIGISEFKDDLLVPAMVFEPVN